MIRTVRTTITIVGVAIAALIVAIFWQTKQDLRLSALCEARGGTYLWRDRVCVKTVP